MWRLFIFLVLVMFKAEANLPDNDSVNFSEVTFATKTKIDEKHVIHFICDHNDNNKLNNIYTVLEGEEFKIITKHNSLINHLICRDFSNGYQLYDESASRLKSLTTFIAKKQMGSLWTCTVLSNRDSSLQHPVVLYEGHTYSAVYCSIQIHVRQTSPPQTILVNNVALQTVRTDLSEKDVDFTAEYEYTDGDVVNVACITFLGTARLTMEYPMADTLSDKFTSGNLSSSQAIGFHTKLHSGHNNSYMTCTSAELTDYTKVVVRFVMRPEFNIVRVKINGMTLRPKLYKMQNALYRIEYKYISNRPIKVVCEVVRADVVLVIMDLLRGFVGEVNGYNKTELKPSKQSEMSFHLNGENTTLSCGSDYSKGGSAEIITITFSESKFPTERPPHMELPPNGTVMELYDYDDDKSRNAIFYEFEDGERLQLKCGPLHSPQPGPVLYLQFQDSRCRGNGCYVTLNLTVTNQHDNSEIVCRLRAAYFYEKVLKEIRVILRKRDLITINTTTTTTSTAQPKDHEPVPDVVVSVVREAAVRGRSGGAATLACEARYEPLPRDLPLLEIHWQKGEQPISPQGSHWSVALHTTRRSSSVESRLTLTDLSARDAGAYSCNAAGRTAALTLTLDDDGQKSTKRNVLAYSLSAVGVLIFVVLLLLYLKARKRCCYRSRAQEMPVPRPDPASVYYENTLSVFAPINEREAEAMENHYEEIQ